MRDRVPFPVANMDALAKLSTHEAVCAERYEGINDRLARLEKIMITGCGGIIVFMAGLIATLALHR